MKITEIEKSIPEIECKIGYALVDKTLLIQALSRSSFRQEHLMWADNEELEFIGDSVLGMVVVKKLTHRYAYKEMEEEKFRAIMRFIRNSEESESAKSRYNWIRFDLDENELSEAKISLVRKETLAYAIDKAGLSKYLIVGAGDEKNNICNESSVKEDLFEAIVGAVAIDSNWNICVIEKVIDKILDPDELLEYGLPNEIDYRLKVTDWYERHYKEMPKLDYHVYEERALPYTCWVELGRWGSHFLANGNGVTKAGAERMAFKRAWRFIQEERFLGINAIKTIGEVTVERSINQLQELWQKKILGEPQYFAYQNRDDFGDIEWQVDCVVHGSGSDSVSFAGCGYAPSKIEAKKLAANEVLIKIMATTNNDDTNNEEDL